MDLRGWVQKDLAFAAQVSDMTVGRLLRGEPQTTRVAQKLADALGYSTRRYVKGSQKRTPSVRDTFGPTAFSRT